MKNLCLFILIVLLYCNDISAQCPQGNITLTSQQEVDDFTMTYPGCTDVLGNLSISISGLSVTDLNGLADITTVSGDLRISNTDLTSLEGLENLSSVGEDLRITNNPDLTTLAGLENLSSIGVSLYIKNNNNLTTLTGLEGVNIVNRNFEIEDNANLMTLTGLENLNTVTKSLYIADNPDLTSLTGLEGLHTIGQEFYIRNNDNLMNLTGLESLSSVVRGFYINANDNLMTLTGLENLSILQASLGISGNGNLSTLTALENISAIGGSLGIGNNDNLTTLAGLENVTSVGENLSIANNDNLTTLAALGNISTIGGDLRVHNNDALSTLMPLENITSVPGELAITNNENLTNLIGLQNITSVGKSLIIENNDNLSNLAELQVNTVGGLFVRDNDNLSSLTGLENIMFIGLNLTIDNNDNLSNLSELENIVFVGADLEITNNDNLVDLTGLENISYVGGTLLIENNLVLTTLTGLENVSSTLSSLRIIDNPNLTTLTGLEGISSTQNLLIINNPNLTTLTGLENLNVITGSVDINDNTNLMTLTALENLASIGGYLSIRRNDQLTTCGIAAICNYLAIGVGFVGINDNATGCDTRQEVENACTNTATCASDPTSDTLTQIFDEDLFIDGIGFANNPNITFPDPATPADAVLSDISLELYFRLNGITCENEIAIQITDPAGSTQALTAYTTCDGDDGLYYVNLNVPSGNTTGSVANWLVEFDDTNDQNSDYEYSVRFARLNYVATTAGSGATIVNEVLEIADMDLFIDGVGFANNPNVTFPDPGTPANAVLSDISLELYFKLNGNSCENEIAIQITDPAGNTQPLTAFTTCDGGTGLYFVNLDVPSGNTTGSVADWTVQFDDTNDQNTGYEYSVRFGRLTYTTTHTEGREGVQVTVNEEVSDFADADLFIDGVGFANNDSYTFTDPGTPVDAVLSDISLELYFRLNGNSCENEIALQLTDPVGNTQSLTAYTTCDGDNGLYYINLDVPSGNTTGSVADWLVEFDDTNDQNSDYEYSVRFGRLTYNTEYTDCVPMLANENNNESQQVNNSSTQQLVINPSTRQLNNSSLKLYPVPANQHLNVEYFSENTNSANIEIISNNGKTLLSKQEVLQEGVNTIQLEIADLPAGHYHIRVYNTEDIQMQSFVKIAP